MKTAATMRPGGPMQVFEPDPDQRYPLESAAYLAGVSRRTLLLYCRSGLVRPAEDAKYGRMLFDERAIRVVRRAEDLRNQHRMDFEGVKMIFELLAETERLRDELRFLRGD